MSKVYNSATNPPCTGKVDVYMHSYFPGPSRTNLSHSYVHTHTHTPSCFPSSRPHNHVVARRPNANPLDLDADKLLNVLNVRARLVRQVVERLGARRRLLPAGERLVDDLDLCENVEVRGEALEALPVVRVADGDLELVKVVEHVQLGQVDGRVVVARVRVLDDDEIQPAAASCAACCDADFVADFLEPLACFVELLSGEGAAASC
jgi:hypothetical protein